jgi:hypothetical protein
MQNRYHRVGNPVGDESETVARIGRRWDILLPMLVLLWFAGSTSAAIEAVPSYAEIKAAVDAAYQARHDVLKNATGVVDISFHREPLTKEDREKYQKEMSEGLGVDGKHSGWGGTVQTTTTWYTKGNRTRYDIVSPKPTDPRPLLIEGNRRVVTDPEKSISYDVLHREAYIDRPLRPYANPFGQLMRFDVHLLYRFHYQTVSELLYHRFEEETPSERTYEITREKLGPTECIRVYCQLAYTHPSGEPGPAGRLELWLAPQMAYSLVKARTWSRRPWGWDYYLQGSYDASYEQSPTHPGIWVLKTLDCVVNHAPEDGSEILKATFTNTRVGVELPEETFTFDGLGVPPGTVVYDKSRGGTYPSPRYPGTAPVFPRYYYLGRGRLEAIDG